MIIQELLDKQIDKDFIEESLSLKKFKRLKTDIYFDIKDENNKELALKLYEEYKIPIYKIAVLSGVSEKTAKNYLTKYGFKNRGHKTGKNSENNYFENIDTPDKAYFLGFIFADGSVQDLSTETKERKTLSLTIMKEDGYLLQLFLNYSGIKTNIYTTHKDDKNPRNQINIWSCKIYNDLYKLGVKPNKSKKETFLTIPDIRSDLISHFIRGYFDGDGIAFSDQKIGFCGNLQILEFIRNQLFTKLKLNGNPQITFNEANHIYYLVFGKRDAKIISEFLYQDKKDLYLIRKYDIYRPL